ncbi:Fur family transcriptional regulator [Mangrovicoccus algicola]|uniref:Transcriptional repressor n=1 Tax=Mangrovicoccus algicola TaxID=2771008 RepID=A0A8J7CZI2_9RHOB|nr:Fur family transcriptional regulator [Mangrovicoccus algicola]MBE3637918.1 transcriptional repressor [Mangrovicoccus algicola]
MTETSFTPHDHGACISQGVEEAVRQCREAGLKLTPVRRRVLEILLERHRAMGAYEILDRLREEGLGSQPPVAYRALDFLTANGFAHRIERLNAFVACTHAGDDHTPAFLICRNCSRVAETDSTLPRRALAEAAKGLGFSVERAAVEAEGLCPACLESAS